MPVELQSFVLCQSAEPLGNGMANCLGVGVSSINAFGQGFPRSGGLAFYLGLRKDSKLTEIPCTVAVQVIDADGNVLPVPGRVVLELTFPPSSRFLGICHEVELALPHAGDYSILLDVRSQGEAFQYRYDLEATDDVTPQPDKTKIHLKPPI